MVAAAGSLKETIDRSPLRSSEVEAETFAVIICEAESFKHCDSKGPLSSQATTTVACRGHRVATAEDDAALSLLLVALMLRLES